MGEFEAKLKELGDVKDPTNVDDCQAYQEAVITSAEGGNNEQAEEATNILESNCHTMHHTAAEEEPRDGSEG
eukprot:12203048-Alexandrium_andersonii.AAC.1